MLKTVSEELGKNLMLVRQVQGMICCDPLQYICTAGRKKYLLAIAINNIQKNYFEHERLAEKYFTESMDMGYVSEIVLTGVLYGYMYILFDLDLVRKNARFIRKSVRKRTWHVDVTKEIINESLKNLTEFWPKELREDIRRLEEYKKYCSALESFRELELGIDIVNVKKREIILPADCIWGQPQNSGLAKLRKSFIDRVNEIWKKKCKVTITLSNENIDVNCRTYPDIIFNRFDLQLCDYIELDVQEWTNNYKIQIKIEGKKAVIGCYFSPVSQDCLKAIIKYLFHNLKEVVEIDYSNILWGIGTYKQTEEKIIRLPDTVDDLRKNLSSKGRYNLKREKRKIKEEIGNYVIDIYEGESIPKEIVEKYFEYKGKTHKRDYHMSYKEYLQRYCVSTAYVMRDAQQILAIVFSCEQCPNVYFENFSYNTKYKAYSIGSVMYDIYLEQLIDRGRETVFLGGGEYDYKKRYGSIAFITYSGMIYRNPLKTQLIQLARNCVKIAVKVKHRTIG